MEIYVGKYDDLARCPYVFQLSCVGKKAKWFPIRTIPGEFQGATGTIIGCSVTKKRGPSGFRIGSVAPVFLFD